MPSPASEVLEFWFGERARPLWFATSPAFDDEIRSRFGALVATAASGALDHWTATRDEALALIVALDQFSRNMYRGSPRAFEQDARARQAAERAIEDRLDLATPLDRRMFFYMPFHHSESLLDQERSIALFSRWVMDHPASQRAHPEDQMSYVLRYHAIIQRFGRFPHRNATLGRTSTPAELAFLAEQAPG